MYVDITSTVRWIYDCIPIGEAHMHLSVYLIRDEDRAILIDAGPHMLEEPIRTAITQAVDTLDAIVLSHSDLPHADNFREFRESWEVDVYSPAPVPEIRGLPADVRRCHIGESQAVAGHNLVFLTPPLADVMYTTWVFDPNSEVLFTADGFGSYHASGACGVTTAEIPDVDRTHIRAYNQYVFPWLRYVNPSLVREALDETLGERHLSVVAPAHGHPIVAADIPDYLDAFEEAISEQSN